MWKIRDLIVLSTLKIKNSVLSVFNGSLFFDEQQIPTISSECTPNKPVGLNTYGEIVNINISPRSEYVVDIENGFLDSIGLPEAPFLSIEQALSYISDKEDSLNIKIKLVGQEHEITSLHQIRVAGKLTISSEQNANLTFATNDAKIEILDGGSIELKNISVEANQNSETGSPLIYGDITNMVLISSQVNLGENTSLYQTYMTSNLRLIGSTITNESSTVVDNLGGGITFVSLDEVSSISKSECSSIITHRIQEEGNCKNLVFSSYD